MYLVRGQGQTLIAIVLKTLIKVNAENELGGFRCDFALTLRRFTNIKCVIILRKSPNLQDFE